MSLSQAAYDQYGLAISGPLFVGIYALVACLLTIRKHRIVDILGYFMTPAIVLSISAVVIKSLLQGAPESLPSVESSEAFMLALTNGLRTQDFIAAFFFSSILCELVGAKAQNRAKFVLSSCAVGVGLLSFVYLTMILCGKYNADILANYRGDQLLYALLTKVGSEATSSLSLVIITLSCLSTSVALNAVIAHYIQVVSQERISFATGVVITSVISAIPAIYGFETISAIIGPSMEVLYPLLLATASYAVLRKFFFAASEPSSEMAMSEA